MLDWTGLVVRSGRAINRLDCTYMYDVKYCIRIYDAYTVLYCTVHYSSQELRQDHLDRQQSGGLLA